VNAAQDSRKDKSGSTILVVDDQPEVRSLIADYLRSCEGYTVFEAQNGKEALDVVLSRERIDLVLSDINMPIMKGFELLKIVRDKYPATKRVLITACDVEDYLDLAIDHDVGNIFTKTFPFNFHELSTIVNSLLSGSVFGLDKYFDSGAARLARSVTDPRDMDTFAKEIVGFLPQMPKAQKLQLVLLEMLTNAVFYGWRREQSGDKREWSLDFVLPDNAVEVVAMYDAEKCAVSVVDHGGGLSKADVLYWLHRQTATGEDGIPVGLYDHHGRGFYIARRYVDRLIINIEKGKRTEVIVMDYLTSEFAGHKPLYINEL